MERLTGKIAIVTGGSRGIGRAIALRLAREGAEIGLCYRSNSDQARQTAAEIEALGRRVVPLVGDVRHDADVRSMVEKAQQTLGGIHIWVNNAGVEHEKPISEISDTDWDDTFAVNVKGLFFCARAAGEAMVASAKDKEARAPVGSIINIASRFGFLGDSNSLPYGASKAAVINLTKALAKHYAPLVRVNAVAPAYTPTDMMAHVGEEYLAEFHAATPLGRPTRPEDIAAAVAFLASDDAAFTTGATLPVDGGYTLK